MRAKNLAVLALAVAACTGGSLPGTPIATFLLHFSLAADGGDTCRDADGGQILGGALDDTQVTLTQDSASTYFTLSGRPPKADGVTLDGGHLTVLGFVPQALTVPGCACAIDIVEVFSAELARADAGVADASFVSLTGSLSDSFDASTGTDPKTCGCTVPCAIVYDVSGRTP